VPEFPLDSDGPLQRTDLQDTALHIHRRMIELLRRMTPEQRIQRTFEMMESIRHLREVAGIARDSR